MINLVDKYSVCQEIPCELQFKTVTAEKCYYALLSHPCVFTFLQSNIRTNDIAPKKGDTAFYNVQLISLKLIAHGKMNRAGVAKVPYQRVITT